MNITFPCHYHSPPRANISKMESKLAHECRISPMTSPTHQGAAAAQGKEAGTPPLCQVAASSGPVLCSKEPTWECLSSSACSKNTRGSNKISPWYFQTASLLNNTTLTSNPSQICQSMTLDWEHNPLAKSLLMVLWICWRDLAHSST